MNVLSLFNRDQVHVCIYDDIENSPLESYQSILTFLEVDSTFCPSKLTERVNRIIFPHAQQLFAKLGLKPLIEFVKSTPLGSLIKQNYNSSGRQQVTANRSDYLTMFADDINKLENIMNIKLSHWRK